MMIYNVKKDKEETALKILKLEELLKQKSKQPKLMVSIFPSINIQSTVKSKQLSYSKTRQLDIQPTKLSITKPIICNFPPVLPKPHFHPHIVEACKQIYGKRPEELSEEEKEHFRGYREWKIRNGMSVEEDTLYKPTEEPT